MNAKMGLLLGGLLLAGAAGCTDVEPGDYMVYRVASAEFEESDSCDLTANEINDSSTLEAAGTFILFAGQEEDYYLDMGSLTLQGVLAESTSEGDAYEFDGETVDIEWSNPEGNGTKVVTKVTHQLDVTVDDKLVTGEYVIKTKRTCSGDACEGIPYSCNETTDFVGTEVEDVDLEHNVD